MNCLVKFISSAIFTSQTLICFQFHLIISIAPLSPESTWLLHLHPLHSIKLHSMPNLLPCMGTGIAQVKYTTLTHESMVPARLWTFDYNPEIHTLHRCSTLFRIIVSVNLLFVNTHKSPNDFFFTSPSLPSLYYTLLISVSRWNQHTADALFFCLVMTVWGITINKLKFKIHEIKLWLPNMSKWLILI